MKNDDSRTAPEVNDRRPYEPPKLSVYTAEEILAGIGPAIAIYSAGGSGPGGLLP
jgi:hypothetical protein